MKTTVILIAAALALSGCKVLPSLTLTGGNKAGNVKVSTTMTGPVIGK